MGKSQGEIAEIKFLLRARERGYDVSRPYGDNAKYDFILDIGNKLLKIQVKSNSQKTDKYGSIKIGVGHGTSIKKRYTSKQVDFFAIYLRCIDSFYLVPIRAINNRVTIRIYPGRKICTWVNYRENWRGVQKDG